MNITITSKAEKQLRKLSRIDQIIIAKKLRALPDGNSTQLVGIKNAYRVRVGDFRIVYVKNGDTIEIVLIGHRKDVYDILKRLVA